ncbi:MAG: glycosyltransferase family 2 protein [Nitrosopumilus sp.]|nr:glycosyltransferase family 2 protein [Nitrosopumilus sp.]NNL59617.1 glycosyltransferase family 2 protein [Nitrosopumilus sp.]
MRFIEKPVGKFIDKKLSNNNSDSIDVLMLTLDAELSIEKSLFSIYKEIPVNRLIVCDGGSKDNTIQILKKMPRSEIYVKPEIRTTGKALEFLFSKIETDWFVLIDADIDLEEGWYEKMLRHSDSYDIIENGKRISAYHFYREQKSKAQENERALDLCHLIKKQSIKNYHCDDDYMWRYTDIFLRQIVEKEGFRYGKANDTFHVHNEIERAPYTSDPDKNFQEIKFREPEFIIHDQKKMEQAMIKHAKAVVKYLDPDYPMVKNNRNYETIIQLLDREWVLKNGSNWLKRYDASKSMKSFAKKVLSNLKDSNR